MVKDESEMCIVDPKEHVNFYIRRREGLKAKISQVPGKMSPVHS